MRFRSFISNSIITIIILIKSLFSISNSTGSEFQCSHQTASAPPTSRPLWWWVGPACRDWNDHQSPGSSVTQCHLAMNDTHFIRTIIPMRLNVMCHCFMCRYSGQQCCVKDVSFIWNRRRVEQSLGRSLVRTHTYEKRKQMLLFPNKTKKLITKPVLTKREILKSNIKCLLWWRCYPTASEGWRRGGTPRRSPNSQATPQGQDQRSISMLIVASRHFAVYTPLKGH